jgi:hypothetical protein
MKNIYLVCLACALAICGCRDNDKDVIAGTDDLSVNFHISAGESNDNLTIKAEFRSGDAEETIRLTGEITLDGQELSEDSTKRGDYYYETFRPVATFPGVHSLQLTIGGNSCEEKFDFIPLVLASVVPDTVRRGDLILELEGVSGNDIIRILLTDTTAAGDGLSLEDSAADGRIMITFDELAGLASGPVLLEIFRETASSIECEHLAGGNLFISYGLRRQFILAD